MKQAGIEFYKVMQIVKYVYYHKPKQRLRSSFWFQSIMKNRKHWSSQTLDDNVLMVRSWHERKAL